MFRPIEPSDTDFLFLLENDREVASAGFGTAPASRRMLWDYANNYTADIFAEKQLRLIILDPESGRPAGTVDIADFNPRDRRGFVGIAIAPEFRRRGIATAALEELCNYAARELGMHQLAALVAYDNAPSRALFARAGFKQCGHLRSWIRHGESYRDAVLLQKLLV